MSLLRDAGDALSQAKEDGRDRITVFDDAAKARVRRRRNLGTALRRALANNELRLEYQPILELGHLEVAGFEALLRWDHPGLGPIGPDEFIPIAEATGLIHSIGGWVFEQALHQLAMWHADVRVRADVWLAINLSAQQLGHPDLIIRIGDAVRRAGVPPDLVHFEITESVLMDRVDNAMHTIGALRELGVRVSIDDFGTGYSSLSYLSRLAVDEIKIDRSFVQGIGGEGHAGSIVRTITALAETLGLDVVAEGVELPEQLALLRALGCTYGQGYLWSRPLRPEAAFEWMLTRDRDVTATR